MIRVWRGGAEKRWRADASRELFSERRGFAISTFNENRHKKKEGRGKQKKRRGKGIPGNVRSQDHPGPERRVAGDTSETPKIEERTKRNRIKGWRRKKGGPSDIYSLSGRTVEWLRKMGCDTRTNVWGKSTALSRKIIKVIHPGVRNKESWEKKGKEGMWTGLYEMCGCPNDRGSE